MSNARDIADAGHHIKAWVNFNGSVTFSPNPTTPASSQNIIRAVYNFSSIQEHSGGDYTLTFENAMDNRNYAVVFGAGRTQTGSVNSMTVGCLKEGYAPSALSFRMTINYQNGGLATTTGDISVAVFAT